MITLSELSRYLQNRRQATLSEMSIYFGSSQDAVRGALDLMVSKGRVRKLPVAEAPCGRGCSASCECVEVFEWVGPTSSSSH
ncbi:FeoC-like transcriptional regulator [Rhodomicrobium sp. Az07]|uniref:FeoC-like transcriptional regulator n=1 Tax=Rhodomicrobium sp. Az07 TaxID=2839034 RepID=UPI001BE83957|nr:FeoC-like transcriptional regulator [Rhodomicrobium sp. Az07]